MNPNFDLNYILLFMKKSLLKKDDIYKFTMSNSKRTIGDEIALSIGSLGENMILRRAVILNLKENESLSWYMHGSSKIECLLKV